MDTNKKKSVFQGRYEQVISLNVEIRARKHSRRLSTTCFRGVLWTLRVLSSYLCAKSCSINSYVSLAVPVFADGGYDPRVATASREENTRLG